MSNLEIIYWYVLSGIIAGVIVFFLLKKVINWYYKIDYRVTLMEEQNRLLRKLVGEPEPETKK